MKTSLITAIFLSAFSISAFAADYTYKVADSCANGLTLTFSTQQTMALERFEAPLYECTDLEAPTAPEDSGCRASQVVGKNVGYKVQLGTLQYSNDRGQKSSAPMSINLYADLRDDSGLTEDSLTYQLDGQLNSLDTANSTFGPGLDETWGMALDNLPAAAGKKEGHRFPSLDTYADQVFEKISSVVVYVPGCANRVTAMRQ